MQGIIYQINIKPQTLNERGMPKLPVDSCKIMLQGLEGDFNKYRSEKKQNDPDNAVLIMPLEMILILNAEGWPIRPGHVGENLTTEGIHYDSFAVGNKYRVGEAILQISNPCTPCRNLHILPYVGEEKAPLFIKTLINRRGWYARVLQEGLVKKGDTISELSD